MRCTIGTVYTIVLFLCQYMADDVEVIEGNPRLKYPNPILLEHAIGSFWDYCKEEKVKPSKMRMCQFLGLSQSGFDKYELLEGFADVVKRAKEGCETFIFELALDNKVNPNVALAYMRAKHGWTEKTETKTETQHTFKIETTSYKDSIKEPSHT